MKGALSYEWRRIISVRSTYWLTGLSILVSGATAFFIALGFRASDLTADGVSSFIQASNLVMTAGASVFIVPVISAPFCAVVGAMSFGHEYRYGTIKQTLTAVPNRVQLFFAKLLVLVGWLFVLMLVIVLVNTLMGALFLDGFSLSTESFRPAANFVLYNVGWGIAGFGLAAILRNLAGALVAVLVYPLVVESIAYNILRLVKIGALDRVANLFPAAAGRRTMFSPYQAFANPDSGSDANLHVWGLAASTAVFWGGLALLTAAAFALFLARDA